MAYLLKLVYRRAPGAVIPVTPPTDVTPERKAELQAQATGMPFDDAIALALAILDRHYPA
jgi:hypothetical protein